MSKIVELNNDAWTPGYVADCVSRCAGEMDAIAVLYRKKETGEYGSIISRMPIEVLVTMEHRLLGRIQDELSIDDELG